MSVTELGHTLTCTRCGEPFLSKPFAGAIPILCRSCTALFDAEDERRTHVEEWR